MRLQVVSRKSWNAANACIRGAQPSPDVQGRTVILTDDGLATGAMRAAATALRQLVTVKIIVAVPVGLPRLARSFETK